jgi:hypothetical protein
MVFAKSTEVMRSVVGIQDWRVLRVGDVSMKISEVKVLSMTMSGVFDANGGSERKSKRDRRILITESEKKRRA